ncbi:MAG: hypothetical protein JNK23_11165 [Opitutaceae bacterium]|nr:hypothetical protein [Opitutaceae bacterium]
MLLSRESPRVRWGIMLATWLACAGLAILHTQAVRDYLALLDSAAPRPAGAADTPLRQLIPARHADAQMWVRHALAAEEAHTLRTRFTTADNTPAGRAVHWSSPPAWLLRLAATAQRAFTGDTGPAALERTLPWFNAPLFLAVLVALSAWVASRAGTAAGAVLALGLAGHPRFYEGFAPTNVDHHGLLAAAVLGLLLGLAFMGAGWRKNPDPSRKFRGGAGSPNRPGFSGHADAATPAVDEAAHPPARRAAIISALCGAFGVWLSAATMLPVIALAGAAGLALAFWRGAAARREGLVFDPALWRLWGGVGAAASVVFYFIEYAPAHLGLRLEVNHPLHALLWWGGAELVAIGGAWAVARPPLWRMLAAGVAVAAAPLTVLLGGRDVFLVGDPFVGALRHFVAEGKSLPAVAAQFGFRFVAFDLVSCLLLVIAAGVLWRRREATALVAGFLALIVAALTAMAVLEMRWWLNVGPAQLALLLALLALVPAARHRGCAAAAGLLLILPAFARIASERADNRRGAVTATDLMQPLYRDLAAALRRDQPEGDIVLLASPNASAGIGYFGRFATLGTLYWENAPGLRAAAEVFSATSDADAERLFRARRITHVAHLSAGNFLGEYLQLLHPQLTAEEARRTFGYRLNAGADLPRWLQPIPYRRPPGLKDATQVVRLYRVAFDQTEAERLYHTAVACAADGDLAAAEQTLAEAALHTPATEHAKLFEAAGAGFYDFGADALAVRTLRRAPGTAVTIAWILATTRDDALRDGRAALALIEPIARTARADPTVLSALAAAYAELGRWPEAVAAAERALAHSGAESARLLMIRLDAYRRAEPWRP